jgi:uncharacterized protein (DUF58 family)
MLVLLISGVLAVGAGALVGAPWVAFWGYNGALALLFCLDFLRAPGKQDFLAARSWEGLLELGRETEVTVTVNSRLPRPVRLKLCDTPPESFLGGRAAEERECPASGRTALVYAVTPTQRGGFSFGGCYAEARGRMGLCVRRFVLPCPGEAAVYPDLAPMRRYRLLAARRQLDREDQAARRARGGGAEFAGIREYTPDDDPRKINWMATARARKLMSNQYDTERSRPVMLAVDLGRWMGAGVGAVTRLDRAAEMAAALAQAALSSGDRVGLTLYDTAVRAYLKPDRGSAQINRILGLLYKARAGRLESSLPELSAHLSRRMRHRGFVCVFTYLDGEEAAAEAGRALLSLSRRHSVLVASLTDPAIGALAGQKAGTLPDLYLKASASYRAAAERTAERFLRARGVQCLTGDPAGMLPALVRSYAREIAFRS